MKSRETLIRLKKFQVDEKRRRVSQIEGMIADFQRMSVDLEREIQTEQERAGINDPSHFAYPTYAKAAIQRRENLTRSAEELRVQLEDARGLLAEAFDELKKVELLDERDQARERAEESAREQADIDSHRFDACAASGRSPEGCPRFSKRRTPNTLKPGFSHCPCVCDVYPQACRSERIWPESATSAAEWICAHLPAADSKANVKSLRELFS